MTIAYLVPRTIELFKIRDQIAAILEEELPAQQALAAIESQDPIKWNARVFKQRRNPIDLYAEIPDNGTLDARAAIVVNCNNALPDAPSGAGELVQHFNGDYSICCYGYGKAIETDEGHDPQDVVAVRAAEESASIVYNILRNGLYALLGKKGVVQQRQVMGINFNPQNIEHMEPSIHIECVEVALKVTFKEQVTANAGVPLDRIRTDHKKLNNDNTVGQTLLSQEAILTTGS